MKLKDFFEFHAVPAVGPKVDRPTPVTFRRMSPPLPQQLYAQREKEIVIPEDEEETPGFDVDIEEETVKNNDYRRVLFTTTHSQLVVMSIEPGDEIGEEDHEVDQFIRFEAGKGVVVMDSWERDVGDGDAVVVPAGVKHNVINTSDEMELKLYAIYSPPQHAEGTVHRTKAEETE